MRTGEPSSSKRSGLCWRSETGWAPKDFALTGVGRQAREVNRWRVESPRRRRYGWNDARRRRYGARRRSVRRVRQELAESRRNVGSRRRRGTRKRFAELVLRNLAQQSALEVAGTVQVDVPAEPLPTGHVRVLLAGSHVELRALAGRSRHVVE